MKQTIPFVKDIRLEPKVYDITSIALEHNLKMENDDSISGVFNVSGKYKINDYCTNEEEFDEDIPFDITLDDKYDAKKANIDIDDFYYEIVNEEFLRIHIDVLLDNLICIKNEEVKEKEEVKIISMPEEQLEVISTIEEEFRSDKCECENDIIEERKEIKMENNYMLDEKNIDKKIDLTTNFLSNEEKYSTYKVHIVRENETINTIIEKYGVSKEELLKYNDLENIILGSKIIVPIENE